MRRLKIFIIIFSDLLIMYGSLAIALPLRSGYFNKQMLIDHFGPFTLIFLIWIIVFYLFNLYSEKFFKNDLSTIKNFLLAMIVNLGLAVAFFYLFSPLLGGFTPKTNLALFTLIFIILDYSWRILLFKIFIARGMSQRTIFIGESAIIGTLIDYLQKNPQLGYHFHNWFKNIAQKDLLNLKKEILENKIEAVIFNDSLKKDGAVAKLAYQLLPLNIKIFDLSDFYEIIFQKVPIEEVEETWFIDQITTSRHFYDTIKRTLDVFLSFVLLIILSLPMVLIAFLIKLNSRGPAVFKQERIGKNDRPFILYKFRTMKINLSGPLATEKNDQRITSIGKFLRFTHLDELPQLINIFKGNISFIGPRPESKNLVEIYQKLPYYEIRHIIKPGLTGWAQINYKPSASLQEAQEKLQYDIYYVKNRSLFLDLLILIKTIRYFFVSHWSI